MLTFKQPAAPDGTQAIKHAREELLRATIEEYQSISTQLTYTTEPVAKLHLQRQLTAKEQEINELMTARGSEPRLAQVDWHDTLPRIDFAQAVKRFGRRMDQIKSEGGALFLIQDSLDRCGELCIKRLQDELRPKHRDVRPYVVSLAYSECSPHSLLSKIGEHYGLGAPRDNLQVFTDDLSAAMLNRLERGTALFFHIDLPHDDRVADVVIWFAEQFWPHLIARLPETAQYAPGVALVAVLTIATRLPKTSPVTQLCVPRKPGTPQPIIELPLGLWSQEDIVVWLKRLAVLPSNLSADQIETVAERMFLASRKGSPALVYRHLQNLLSHSAHP